MPLSISTDAIQEKNKLSSNDPWLLLLEIDYPGETPIRVVWNTEDITWDGETWHAFPVFKLGDMEETKEAEIPAVNLTFFDPGREVIPIVDEHGGGLGSEVWVYVVHSAYLSNTTPEFEQEFEIIEAKIGYDFSINLKLGAENLINRRSPQDRYLKGHCRYKEFKGSLCGYSGSETDCNRTFERCRELGNQARFGGFPGIGKIGYWRTV